MTDASTSPIVLEGWIAVEAALTSGYRSLYQVYLQQTKRKAQHQRLARYARAQNVPVAFVDPTEFGRYTHSRRHGGVIALAGSRRYQPLIELGNSTAPPFVAILDGVEDPYNYGHAIRALYAAGVQGLVVRARNWVGAEALIARASAGASERIPTAAVTSPLEAVEHFKARGLCIACTGRSPDHVSIYEADLRGPLCLVIGGERRGIMRSVVQQADLKLRIPYGGSFRHTLGATSATAILAFEVLRQRLQTP